MKHYTHFRAVISGVIIGLFAVLPLLAQTPSTPGQPLAVDTDSRVKRDFKIPSGKTLQWESGSTFRLDDGTSFNIGSTAASAMRTAIGDLNGMKVFTNAANRAATTPNFTGQIGFQSDTQAFWYANALTVGAWTSVFSFEDVSVTGYVTASNSTQRPLQISGGSGMAMFERIGADTSSVGIEIEDGGGTNAALQINTTGTGVLLKGQSSGVTTTTLDKNGVFLAGYGAVGAPGLSFYGDADTGIYRSGANALSIAANGAHVATFSSSGLAFPGGTMTGNLTIDPADRIYWDGTNAELYYAEDIHGAGRDALIMSAQDTIVIAAGANNQKSGYVQLGTSSATYEYFMFQHNGNATISSQTPGSKKLVFASYYWNGGVGTNYRAMSMRHKTSAAGVGTMDFYANETVGATTGETDAGTHIFSIREGIGAYFPTGYGITFGAGGTITSSGGGVSISALTLGSPLPKASGGTGSATWGQLAIFEDRKATNTSGDAITAGTWNKLTLNTEHCDTGSAFSVSSSVITVATGGGGTYRVEATVPFITTSTTVLRLRRTNNTAATIATGQTVYSWSSDFTAATSTINARVTLSDGDTLELQAFPVTGGNVGYSSGGMVDGESRVYTLLKFFRE